MPLTKDHHLRNLKLAGVSALCVAAGVLANAGIRSMFSSSSHRHTHWIITFILAIIIGLSLFVILFLYFSFVSISNLPLEKILSEETRPESLLKTPMTGFVAMEYYLLIWNRTFMVCIAPEGLYGWKVMGAVDAKDPLYFQPFEDAINEPEFMRDHDGIVKLAELKGGFFIPRAAITSVQVVDKQKWGMSRIRHSGRVRIHLSDGKTRELILLGSVFPDSIRQKIIQGQ